MEAEDIEAYDYDVYVGRKAQTARSLADLSEEEVAERMRHLGYASWVTQTVRDAENGQYRMLAAEVLGLSLALEVSVTDLVQPTGGGQWIVRLPIGKKVPLRGFVPIGWDANTPVTWPPYEKTRHE
ncbi:MAG: hypothetical protein ACLQFR_26650 [Streptosporangiaceae bacterium]